MSNVSYPEHEKLHALDGANNTVGDFIEWLHASGVVLAKWGAPYEQPVVFRVTRLCPREVKWQIEELADERDPVAIGHLLDEHGLAGYVQVGDSILDTTIHLPDPANPDIDWYVTLMDDDKLFPYHERIESMIGRFFDIDEQKLNDEKEQMLASIRTANAA